MSWQWTIMHNLKRNWLVVSKLTWEVWWILTQALESHKKFHFNVLLLSKVYIVWTKTVQRSYLSWHWRVMQNWWKTDSWFGKWDEKFGKFSPEHLKVSKLGLWRNSFIQSRKCMSLKFTEELCVMKMKSDTKIRQELTCRFKIDMKNFTNFDPNTRKSKKSAF